MKKIRDRYKDDKPREKIQQKGVRSLSDEELAMAIIGSGNKQVDVTKIADDLVKILKDNLGQVTYDDLCQIKGMGQAHAAQILATFELADRYSEANYKKILDSAEKVLPLLADICDKQQEHFVVLTLDGSNRLIKKRTITIGTLTASLVHPREVFAPAIEDRAAGIIVAHNHPSGNLEPSSADREVTDRLKDAGDLLGINLLDHIIVTKDDYRSIM